MWPERAQEREHQTIPLTAADPLGSRLPSRPRLRACLESSIRIKGQDNKSARAKLTNRTSLKGVYEGARRHPCRAEHSPAFTCSSAGFEAFGGVGGGEGVDLSLIAREQGRRKVRGKVVESVEGEMRSNSPAERGAALNSRVGLSSCSPDPRTRDLGKRTGRSWTPRKSSGNVIRLREKMSEVHEV